MPSASLLLPCIGCRRKAARQFFFKYCSTFNSTPDGNIGPVADALADALAATRVVVCPAYPSLKRSIYQGHLFVGDKLLNESGMEKHPLTPMTDPDLRRWLARQSRSKVGHVAAPVVLKGRKAIRAALDAADGRGERLIVVDTINDSDLVEIGAAAADLPLITGGSGIALGLPDNFRARGALAGGKTEWRGSAGPVAVLSGSCSTATRGQVERHRAGHPALEVLAEAVMDGSLTPGSAVAWATGTQGQPAADLFLSRTRRGQGGPGDGSAARSSPAASSVSWARRRAGWRMPASPGSCRQAARPRVRSSKR